MRRLLRDTPLSLRLTALYVAILITVLGILGGVIYMQVERFLLDDVRERNLTGARNAINRPAPFRRGNGFPSTTGGGTLPVYGATPVGGGGPTSGNGEGPTTDVNRLGGILMEVSSRETTAQIFGTDCTLLAVATQAIPDQPTPPACDVAEVQQALAGPVAPKTLGTEGARAMVLLVPLSLNGGTPGVLQLTTSLGAADGLLARLRLILLLGASGAIIIGAALGVSVTRTARGSRRRAS